MIFGYFERRFWKKKLKNKCIGKSNIFIKKFIEKYEDILREKIIERDAFKKANQT